MNILSVPKFKQFSLIIHQHVHTSKISKPAMSSIPKKEAPCRLVLSKALLTRPKIQRNSRSNIALARASTAKSACQTNTYKQNF